MTHILILAALPEEADAVFAEQGAIVAGAFPERRVRVNGQDVRIVTCGIGKVHAALATGLNGGDAAYILMTGTCGALRATPGQAYWIAEAVQHDYGTRERDSFRRYRGGSWPMGDPGEVHFTAMDNPGIELPHARIASGDSFVACPDSASEMAETLAATLVDMEVAAVAQSAAYLGKPWGAVKAVTDEANGDSSQDFRANLLRAAGQAAAAIEALVLRLDVPRII